MAPVSFREQDNSIDLGFLSDQVVQILMHPELPGGSWASSELLSVTARRSILQSRNSLVIPTSVIAGSWYIREQRVQTWLLRAKRGSNGFHLHGLWCEPARNHTHNLPISGQHSTTRSPSCIFYLYNLLMQHLQKVKKLLMLNGKRQTCKDTGHCTDLYE